MFDTVHDVGFLGLTLSVPELGTLEPSALLLTIGALVAMSRFKIGMLTTLAVCAVIGTALRLVL